MKNLKLKRKSKRRKSEKILNAKAINTAKSKGNKLLAFKAKMFKSKEKSQNNTQATSWKIPKTAQETIPIERIYADSIWQVGNRYSKTWTFSDINVQALDEEEKKNILLTYSAILKSLPDEAQTKISLVNKKMSRERFAKESLLPLKSGKLGNEDKLGDYRHEYNQILLAKKEKGNNLTKERLLTVTVEKRNIDEARNFFIWLSNDLIAAFKKLSSNLHELMNNERLSLLHDFFRIDEEDNFRFDFSQKRIDGSRPSFVSARVSHGDWRRLLEETLRFGAQYGDFTGLAALVQRGGFKENRSCASGGRNGHYPFPQQAE